MGMGVLTAPRFHPLSLSLQSQLHPNCSTLGPNPHNDSNSTTWCSWAPFGKAEHPQAFQNPHLWQLSSPHSLKPGRGQGLAGGQLLIKHPEVIK